MEKRIRYCIIAVVVNWSGLSIAQDMSEEMIMPARDFITEEHKLPKLSAPLASGPFNYTVKKRLINGRVMNRVNLVHVGDGYAYKDTNQFYETADSNMAYLRGLSSIKNNAMVMRPFPRYDKFFNWYQINLISDNTGIPGALQGQKDNDRMSWVNSTLAHNLFSEVQKQLGIKFNWKTAITNIAGYYNSGGSLACFSRENWGDIAVHEQGHSFFRFDDEYFSSNGSSNTSESQNSNTTATVGSSKWSSWVGYRDIDPRTRSGGGLPSGDTVGYYQGARYVQMGQYRPTANSKMNMTSQRTPTSFNAPCREKIIQDIYTIVRPVDTMLIASGTLSDPDSVWVRVIDPVVLKVDWYVDDVLLRADGGMTLKKSEISQVPGTYTVKAHVYDEVIRHMFSDNNNPDELDLVRGDTSNLYQDVQWRVSLTSLEVTRSALEKPAVLFSVNKTTVKFSLPDASVVEFDLVSADGALVKRMRVPGMPGRNSVDITNGKRILSSGMYFLKMKTGSVIQTSRIVVF